jgi:hypothetical protein
MRPLLAATFLLVLALLGGVSATGARAGEPSPQAHGSAPTLPLAARSACFGAAARDPFRAPCRDARLNEFVYPRPALASQLPNSPCSPVERQAHMNVCGFGVAPEDASETIALVGDSHASHWRAALDVVAQERGWRGLSIAHTSCPLSKAVRNLEGAARFKACVEWKQAVFAWFRQHPEIHTVFVAGLSGGAGVIPPKGVSAFGASVLGYRRAWRDLPATVTRIVVIRDTPKMRKETGACVNRALSRGRRPGATCSMRRRLVLDRDPLVVAASKMPASRVRTVDLTRFFCDRGPCYPVIGGALVLRDQNHMTAVFSTTLGPYLLRKVDALWASWSE